MLHGKIKPKPLLLLMIATVILFSTSCRDRQIPPSYDLRRHNRITPVRNQNGEKADGTVDYSGAVGLCWAFASLTNLESNMLTQGLLKGPASDGASLSPWYLGNYIGLNEPCYEHNPETIPGVEPKTAFGYYSEGTRGWGGGGSFWLADYLISGKELPLWKDAPMPVELINARQPLVKPVAERTKKYAVKEMRIIFSDDFPNELEHRNYIKKYIMENGAVQSMVHLEPIDLDGIDRHTVQGALYTGSRFMDKENHNLYTYETENLSTTLFTHAVAITGWDDNRRVSIGGRETAGCWLIKDSSGPVAHDGGYFWAAYDDPIVNVIHNGIIVQPDGRYKHPSLYQTHAGGLSEILEGDSFPENGILELGVYSYLTNGAEGKDSWGFAEFKIDRNEKLAAVAVFTGNRNENVTVNVYKNSEKDAPLLSKQFRLADIGYHLLDLGGKIPFSAGDTITIGIGFEYNEAHKRLPLVYARDEKYHFNYPTYFGTLENNQFNLIPYSDLYEHCAFFVQAVMAL